MPKIEQQSTCAPQREGVSVISGEPRRKVWSNSITKGRASVGEFGRGDLIRRMPLFRPPVAPANIAFIEKWIDDGCPDEPMDLIAS